MSSVLIERKHHIPQPTVDERVAWLIAHRVEHGLSFAELRDAGKALREMEQEERK